MHIRSYFAIIFHHRSFCSTYECSHNRRKKFGFGKKRRFLSEAGRPVAVISVSERACPDLFPLQAASKGARPSRASRGTFPMISPVCAAPERPARARSPAGARRLTRGSFRRFPPPHFGARLREATASHYEPYQRHNPYYVDSFDVPFGRKAARTSSSIRGRSRGTARAFGRAGRGLR